MNLDRDNLERLFSRLLDGEATRAEQQELRSLLRADPQTRRDFEEYRDLDRQVQAALREAAGAEPRAIPLRPHLRSLGRGLIVAAAAGLAALAWLHPRPPVRTANRTTPVQANAVSWFATPNQGVDAVTPVPSAYVRPELRVRGTQRDLIVVPGSQPGTYFIIEVDRVRTHVIGVHQDF